jgi:hypothetical protein
MSRLYACIISSQNKNVLADIAHRFAHSIEVLDDGILFDVSGLERLIGRPERVAQKILAEIKRHKIPGHVGVADTVDAAMLLCVVVLALRAQRYWPMWMAAILLDTVVTHLLMLSPPLMPWSYSVMVAAWSYPHPLLLAAGAWRHRKRIHRYGTDPAWSV